MEHDDVLGIPAPKVSDASAARMLRDHWGIEATSLTVLPSERDLNRRVDDAYVLKVSNPAEKAEQIDLETEALAHAARVAPDLPLPRTVPSTGGLLFVPVSDDDGRPCLARVITVLPGHHIEGLPVSVDLAEAIGGLAARTSIALQGLFHPAASRGLDWDVRRAAQVLKDLDPAVLGLTADQLAELRTRSARAAEASRSLPSGLNHADLTLTNVLTIGDDVTGLIDFGDMHHTAHICDLAVTVTAVIRSTSVDQIVGTWPLMSAAITGYQRVRLLEPDETDILGDLIVARLAVSLAISARRSAQHPDNLAVITQYDRASRRVLAELLAMTPPELAHRLHRIAGSAHAPRALGRTVQTPAGNLLERRRSVMGGSLSPLFYTDPLTIVRGSGPWLFADDGTRYLDAYNNVAVIGHAHPAVVQAVSRQLSAVNTHSRYLHDGVVELAERLLATMPAGLDTCLFTTSGTEANELAWRLSTAYNGGTGAIIAEHAYHGSTKWFADLSSNEWPPGYTPAHVATFAAPRPRTGGTDRATAIERITAAADRLRGSGDAPSLVLADLGFTSEGILDAPDDFVEGLVEGARQVGALFLADEVQAGYGRIGPAMWRFAAHGATPDIVTLGKPMGAGYPIGAVITRREIADSLARDYEYFSTFAGTPGAAAAALAVLDTLHESDLPAQALRVGSYLRERLTGLADRHSALGEIRGRGLMAGVDTLGADGRADRQFSRLLLNELTGHGVLAGMTGPDGNVLKIRPPLVWQESHVDVLIDALDASLTTVQRQHGDSPRATPRSHPSRPLR